jgi:hypothetical protein
MTVVAVLALAVVGTGRRSPIAPMSDRPAPVAPDHQGRQQPTKVVPAPGDGAAARTPDRMLPGDGRKIVSREEAPVDVNSKSGPRVVFRR